MITVHEFQVNAKYNMEQALSVFQVTIGKEQQESYEIAVTLGAMPDDDWEMWGDKVEAFREEQNIN